MNNLKNRYEIVFFVQAKNCNPNGDPDMGNLPRIDFDTNKAYMTDVSIKRKIRDYILEKFDGAYGNDIFVRSGVNLNKAIAECNMKANDGKIEKGKNSSNARKYACEKFYDIRAFGGVLSTGANAGQVQGVVQFDMPVSIDKATDNEITISRMAYTEELPKAKTLEDYDNFDATLDDNKKRTFGKKTFVPFALFECHAFVSATLANQTGFSEEDLNTLLEAICNMYEFRKSASKNGIGIVGPVIVFKHIGTQHSNNSDQNEKEAILGCAPAQKLFKLIKVEKKDNIEFPRNYEDYNVTINLSKLPNGVTVGFKENPFDEISWGHTDNEWIKEL